MALSLIGPNSVIEGGLSGLFAVASDIAIAPGASVSFTIDVEALTGLPSTAAAGADYLQTLFDAQAADGLVIASAITSGAKVTYTLLNSSPTTAFDPANVLTFNIQSLADRLAEPNESLEVTLNKGNFLGQPEVIIQLDILNDQGIINFNIRPTDPVQWGDLSSITGTYEGIAGTEVTPITVQTGSGSDDVKLTDAIAFADLQTEGGDDVVLVLVSPIPPNRDTPYVQFGHGAYKATIATGAGNDIINIQSSANVGYVRSTPQDIPSYNLSDYYDSVVAAGTGDDYVYAFLPYKTEFRGGDGVDTIFFYGRFSDWSFQTVDANGGGLDITLSNDATDYSIWSAATSISGTAINNSVRGFEFVQFNDIKLDVREDLQLEAAFVVATPLNEGQTAAYSIKLQGDGLKARESVAFTLRLADDSASITSDLEALTINALQAASGITLQNVTVDSAAKVIRAVATASRDLANGATIASFSLPIALDLVVAEGTEQFSVTLEGFARPETIVTQIANVTPVSIGLTGPSGAVREGDFAEFTVTLNAGVLANGQRVTFTLDSASGTAIEGSDYVGFGLFSNLILPTGFRLGDTSIDPATNAVTLSVINDSGSSLTAGNQLLTFKLRVNEDTVIESNENFSVTLASTSAFVTTALAEASIKDATPQIKLIGDTSVAEGATATYKVILDDGVALGIGQSFEFSLDTAGLTASE
ncbi:MAG: hypothetical protein NTZ23_01100, partial [Cyanobium sp. LacPavin_0920_WC12_MAG_63_22]|nr:hypothetical protein [Cyanobium sp. LacPavin_0920_WC12_MAG_63_22]